MQIRQEANTDRAWFCTSKIFVPFVIRRMLKNEVLKLTPGEQKRDFVFIDDVVNAYIKIPEESVVSKPFSEFEIGTGQPVTIKDFVKKINISIAAVR